MRLIIKKYKIFALFCFFLFGNACATQQENSMGQVSWEKRAYLLDGENIFFASMPEEWKTYISNEVVQIHCPDRGVKDSDVQEYFYMYVGKVYEDALTYVSEDFKFADGFVGRRYIERNVKMDKGEEEGSYIEGIISADRQHLIYLCNYDYGLNKGQYGRHKEALEQFYQSAVFQSGQVGIDKNQGDKIRLFIRTDNNIELDIPEGTVFEKVEENDAVCLKFYLDEEKEGVLNLYPYGCQYFNDEVWENKKRLLTDSSYQTDARCYFMEYGGRKIGQFSFLNSDLVVEFSVPEEEEGMSEMAKQIIKSVQVR